MSNKFFERAIRQRMAKTGEPYIKAKAALVAEEKQMRADAEAFGAKAATDLWPKVPTSKLNQPQRCPPYTDKSLQSVADGAFQKAWALQMRKWQAAVEADLDDALSG